MINFFIIFILGIVCLFFLFNKFLLYRSKRHSNKFIRKLVRKYPFKLFFKTIEQGWCLTTLKTSSKLTHFEESIFLKKKWFSVKNKNCSGIADPFLIKKDNIYFLFFEYEYHKMLNKGADLAYAVSEDGINWLFKEKVIQEPFHQSFPYVFLKNNDYYMLPESLGSNQVRLYKAIEFPKKWELDTILFKGKKLADTIYKEIDGIFYWFTTDIDTNQLLLYYSFEFKKEWILHPSSPISVDLKNNRNAGAIITENGINYRVAQNGVGGYGAGINLYEILLIDTNNYIEKPIKEPLFYKNFGVKKDAIHHLSVLKLEKGYLIAVDGANFAVNGLKLLNYKKHLRL